MIDIKSKRSLELIFDLESSIPPIMNEIEKKLCKIFHPKMTAEGNYQTYNFVGELDLICQDWLGGGPVIRGKLKDEETGKEISIPVYRDKDVYMMFRYYDRVILFGFDILYYTNIESIAFKFGHSYAEDLDEWPRIDLISEYYFAEDNELVKMIKTFIYNYCCLMLEIENRKFITDEKMNEYFYYSEREKSYFMSTSYGSDVYDEVYNAVMKHIENYEIVNYGE